MIRVEITQYGRHSESVVDVIGKKLLKRYQDGTVLVVLVEQSTRVPVADLYEFIRKNNPHHQRIYIIGGGAEAGRFIVIPCDEISSPTPGEKAWMEMNVHAKDASMGHLRCEGVVFTPRDNRFSRLSPAFPMFVKKIELRR